MSSRGSDSDLGKPARSRLLGSGDSENLMRENLSSPRPNEHTEVKKLKQLSNLFSSNLFLDEEYHAEDHLHAGYDDNKQGDSSWRLREKMRTVGVALVVCLNIGIDPPDVVKPNPCAKQQCWYDPSGQKQKGLEYIGNALQQQYEKWQSKAKYKQCLDPTSEELRKVLINLRKASKSDRLLLHYNGHGVPKPTKNGELWVFGKHYTHYTPVAICELRSWLGDPAIYVLDCSAAGLLLPHLVDNMNMKDNEMLGYDSPMEMPPLFGKVPSMSFASTPAAGSETSSVVLAACKGNEQLPFHPMYPADVFTACLTTPTTIAIRWFIIQNPNSMGDISPDLAESIPGKDNDRKTPRGELNWILTAITDTIAWNTLPAKLFQKMFRKDLLVASLFRNFLLAKRIMKSFGCTPQSWPSIPDSTTHQLWQSWDMALESFLTQFVSLQKGSSMIDPKNNMSFNMPTNLTFFNDQLSAFEMWLEFGTAASPSPPQLPVVLQVLLSQSHRLRALQLLKRFLALGSEAIKLSLILGIFPYILKLLQNPADDIKQILISIWAAVIGFDASCRQELVREKSQICFIQCISSKSVSVEHRCLASFVLAEVCSNYKEGQQSCLQLGLHRSCTSIIGQPEVVHCSSLKLWTCLCLFKLCEDFLWAKYLCITEAGHTQLYPLLVDPDPTVRTAAVLALGELFGASSIVQNGGSGASTPAGGGNIRQMRTSLSSTGSSEDGSRNYGSNSIVEEKDLREAELQLAIQILECCTDGSVMVRLEAVYALSKFFIQPTHMECIKIVARAIFIRNFEKKQYKVERRSTSPANSTDSFGKNGAVYPWHLTPSESKEITAQIEAFIRARNEDFIEQPYQPHGYGNNQHRDIHGETLLGSYNKEMKNTTTSPGSFLFPHTTQVATSQSKSVDTLHDDAASFTPTPDLATLMASAYVRLWLALTEVQGKDPHSLVAQAAATIRSRVHALIAIEERGNMVVDGKLPAPPASANLDRLRSGSNLSQANSFDPRIASSSPSVNTGFGFGIPTQGSNSSLNVLEQRYKKSFPAESIRFTDSGDGFQDSLSAANSMMPPMSPMGLGITSSPGSMKAKNLKFGSKMPRSSPFLVQPDGQLSASGSFDLTNLSNSLPAPPMIPSTPQAASSLPPSILPNTPPQNPLNSTMPVAVRAHLLDSFKDFLTLPEDEMLVFFSSYHYEMVKKQFMEPNMGYNAYDDPLSLEAKICAYRNNKIVEILGNEKHLLEMFKDVEDRQVDLLVNATSGGKSGLGKGNMDDSKAANVTASTVPNNLCKFEQKNSLYMDSPMSTSLVMFHAFQDILVVASENNASIWSLTTHNRIMDVKNRHVVRGGDNSSAPAVGTPSKHSKSNTTVVTNVDNSLFAPQTTARITAMTWINESYDSLLLLGSDDGVVKVWKDTSCSDGCAFTNGGNNSSNFVHGKDQGAGGGNNAPAGTGNTSGHVSPSLGNASTSVELATAFAALPDIAETTRGSGIVLTWQQVTGSLVVGGNSNTIRVWDLAREQNVRIFYTGVETCLTAMASTTVSNNPFTSSNYYSTNDVGMISNSGTPVSWTFAGFADGSIGVYDERVNSNGGRVHFSHTHGTWINHAHIRADVPEVLIGSVRGTVKFWDLRTMRTYKTLEVQKSPLTSLAVHNCAPIMATGSHAQFIKILTLGGEQLGNIIKYYDGFLGQRIGPVSCLAFHPHKLLLASSSTDGIVSLYGAGDKSF